MDNRHGDDEHAGRAGAESEPQREASGDCACFPANQNTDGTELHVQRRPGERIVAREPDGGERDGGLGPDPPVRRAPVHVAV